MAVFLPKCLARGDVYAIINTQRIGGCFNPVNIGMLICEIVKWMGVDRVKTWKLVSGILSCVLFVLVAFQSCAAGLSNAMSNNGEASGAAGLIVALLMLVGGIVSIVTRKGEKGGGNVALVVIFAFAALIGALLHGSYSDLAIWSGWCFINAVIAAAACILK